MGIGDRAMYLERLDPRGGHCVGCEVKRSGGALDGKLHQRQVVDEPAAGAGGGSDGRFARPEVMEIWPRPRLCGVRAQCVFFFSCPARLRCEADW